VQIDSPLGIDDNSNQLNSSFWRMKSRSILNNIPNSTIYHQSISLCNALEKSSIWSSSNKIAFFIPLPKEPDLRQSINLALKENKIVFLPRIHGNEIELCPIDNLETDLVSGSFGIMEPKDELIASRNQDIDLFLVPGLAFDQQGARIGRGKGFYDRLLAKHPNSIKCGIALTEQLFYDRIPQQVHDIKMNALLCGGKLTQLGNIK
jgi:5-formyltetrahydrofolate cyclo-ligase